MSKGVHNIAFYVSPDPECSRTTQNSEISLAPSRGRILYAIYGNSTCVIKHIVVTAIDKRYRNYYVSTNDEAHDHEATTAGPHSPRTATTRPHTLRDGDEVAGPLVATRPRTSTRVTVTTRFRAATTARPHGPRTAMWSHRPCTTMTRPSLPRATTTMRPAGAS